MKAEMFNFSVGPGEFFIEDGGLDELVRFHKFTQENPTAKLFECSTLPAYEDESSHTADGDCYVILADDIESAKALAKSHMVDTKKKEIKHKVTKL